MAPLVKVGSVALKSHFNILNSFLEVLEDTVIKSRRLIDWNFDVVYLVLEDSKALFESRYARSVFGELSLSENVKLFAQQIIFIQSFTNLLICMCPVLFHGHPASLV